MKSPKDPKVLKSGTITLPAGSIPSPSGGRSSAVDFTHALMQGHPLAEEAVRQAMNRPRRLVSINMPPEEASLADKFVAETYTLPKRLGLNKHQANQVEPILQSYRQDMRKAHRFVLDNDFVRYATEIASTTSPAKLLARVSLASLPYDITWIEFDLKTKVRTMRAIHKMDDSKFDYDQVADRLGLIIRPLSDTEMVVEMVCRDARRLWPDRHDDLLFLQRARVQLHAKRRSRHRLSSLHGTLISRPSGRTPSTPGIEET